ncbi:MAG: ABC transporter permease [Bacilli bacterium]
MKKTRKTPYMFLYTLLGVFLFLLIWYIVSLILNTTLLPSPIDTFIRVFSLFKESSTWIALGSTLYRLLISFLITFLVALLFGIISGFFEPIYRIFKPFVMVFRTIPTAAVIFLLIVLFKPYNSLFILNFLLLFPILYEAVVSGIKNIDDSIFMSLKVECKIYSPKSIFKVILPMASPYIGLGIIQSLGLGMKISIMGEVLCGTNSIRGLGRLIYLANQESNMLDVLAISVISIIFICLLDILLNILKKNIKK